MLQQKSLTQRLTEQMEGNSLALDPARSFGFVYEPNQPLRDTGLPERHVEDDQLDVLTDTRKSPQQNAPPSCLLTLALTRLRSLKAQSKQREKQVAKAIADITGPLKQIDDLVAVLEAEHFQSIANRWDELRKQGRKISEQMESLVGKVNHAMMEVNEVEAKKVRCKTELQAHHEAARKISRWASEKEIEDAERLVAEDREAMQQSSDSALAAQQALAEAQNALAIARGQILGIQRAMDVCEAELKGQPYHDPELGLSTDPLFYREAGRS